MRKKLNHLLLLLYLPACLSVSGTNAFAAEASENSEISKSTVIFIMIAVFIITAVISGYLTFKFKRNRTNTSENDHSKDNKEK